MAGSSYAKLQGFQLLPRNLIARYNIPSSKLVRERKKKYQMQSTMVELKILTYSFSDNETLMSPKLLPAIACHRYSDIKAVGVPML